MPRLPIPGSDDGQWGNILNDYLSQEHNSNGTLKIRTDGSLGQVNDGAVSTAKIQDEAVTAAKLSSQVNAYLADAQTAVQTVNGKAGQSVSLNLDDISGVDLSTASNNQVLAFDSTNWIPRGIGSANGVASLGSDGKVPAGQIAGGGIVASVLDHGVVADGTTNDSVAFQALIDDLAADGGGKIVLPPHVTIRANIVVRPRITIEGAGRTSRIKSVAGSSLPVIGSVKGENRDDPHHVVLRDLMVDGDAMSGSTGMGIEFVSGNNDAYWSIAGWDSGPPAEYWNDPAPIIDGVMIWDVGSVGLRLGRNMRGAKISNTNVYRARTRGISIEGTDMFITNCDVGVCGDGVFFTGWGGFNQLTNVKSWWNMGNTAYGGGPSYAGLGCGFILDVCEGNRLVGVDSQDNYLTGYLLQSAKSNTIIGDAGGDTYSSVSLFSSISDCEWNVLDIKTKWADRDQTNRLLLLDGANVKDNEIRIHDNPDRNRDGSFIGTIVQANSALARNNSISGLAFERWTTVTPGTGANASGRVTRYRKEGNDVRVQTYLTGPTLNATILTLPVHLRPLADVNVPILTMSAGFSPTPGALTIQTDGVVRVWGGDMANVFIDATFPL